MVCITLHLAEVRSDGLPVPSYNDSLQQLDVAITRQLEASRSCIVVLIETLSGKRTWYAYGNDPAVAAQSLSEINSRFPGHKLEADSMPDPHWELWDSYRELFQETVVGQW